MAATTRPESSPEPATPEPAGRIGALTGRAVRDAAWLTADRATAVAWLLFIELLVLAITLPWTLPAFRPGYDFAIFWIAARFALSGHAADAYGHAAQAAMTVMFGPGRHAPLFYPPTALLLWTPLALFPLGVAAGVWIGITSAAYMAGIWVLAGRRAIAFALGFPAVFTSVLLGQTALLTAGLFAGAAGSLDRAPWLAGMLIGCLACKPQLAILAPLALAVAGRWQAFIAAALTVMALLLGSVAAFGVASWEAFRAVLPMVNAWNGAADTRFDLFAGIYAGARLLGAPEAAAWIVQIAAAIGSVVAVILVARRRPGGRAEMAMLVVATGFCVPFLGDYDLVMFAIAGIWLGDEAARTGWLPYERAGLALLFVSPLAIKAAASTLGVPLAPAALVILAVLVLRRIRRVRS